MNADTIAAIATAMTPAGIGIVRISGEEALHVIDRIFRSKDQKTVLSSCASHTIHYGYIYDDDELIDEVLVLLMKAPRSYTREDTVEIDCHGGVYVMKRILEAVIKHGARPAEPGEFTKRAFLNGRMDLTQAESVIDLINSKNDYALQSSLSQLRGSVLSEIRSLRAELLHELAYIESALDDPEHISLEGYPQSLHITVDNIMDRIRKMLDSFDNGRILREGINTVIVGKPNVGKSSLLNFLVGQERAIVTEVAGTTRDVIEEQINLNGITLNIMDTAGIRDTQDVIEKIGVSRAREYAEKADLVIFMIDASNPLDMGDYDIMRFLVDKKVIVLLNKADLEMKVTAKEVWKHLDKPVIAVSAKKQQGIDALEETIRSMFLKGEVSYNDQVFAINARQKASLQIALGQLHQVQQSITNGMPEDFYSIDLMGAYEELGRIIGEQVEDDLVDEIFSKFCMGK